MLVINKKPFNPNRKASAGPTWDQKDVHLTLDNLSSIPTKDITVTGKSLDYYKYANKEETMAEIIATWNLTQYNVLSGVRDVLITTDRILHITENRNKLIGQCAKKLNYFDARYDRINYLLSQAAHTIPETAINDSKTQQKIFDIWTIASCQDASFSEHELNNNTFYNLDIDENINSLKMTNEINNYKIDNNVSVVTNTVTINPCDLITTENETQSTESLQISPISSHDILCANQRHTKCNIKHKKFSKNNRKNKKKKHKQKFNNKKHHKQQTQQNKAATQINKKKQYSAQQTHEVDCSKYDKMIAKTIEMDRTMAIYLANQQNKKKSFNNGDVD